ncbi:MAG: Holliday junction branch migration protein RuvA [Rhabdochlamydiaceae bacterium]
MFEYFRGKLVSSTPTKAVIDIGGIGYAIQISLKTFQKLPQIGSEVFLYVAPIIREDEHTLCGFLTIEEKNLFHQLTSVSGVGPKTAVGILGHVDVTDFQLAVLQGNAALLSKIPGIGKKTAERLVMELKDKFQGIARTELNSNISLSNGSIVSDAISALINLGYHPLDAQKRVNKVHESLSGTATLSQLITHSLRAD